MELTLPITGMHCANCSETIAKKLDQVDGIEQANVDLVAERATVAYDPAKIDVSDVLHTIQNTGYDVALADA